MTTREIRFIGGFGLFHGWLIALLTYTGTEPLGGPGIFAPIALVLAGGMVSAVAFIAVPQRHLKALSAATDALLVAAACLVLAAFLAPSPAVILACCGVCGLLCGALHCLYGLASLAFPKHDFARIIALATIVASAIAIAALLVGEHLAAFWQALVLVALPLSAAFILKAAPAASPSATPSPAATAKVRTAAAPDAPEKVPGRFLRLLLAILLLGIVCRTCDVFTSARFTGLTLSSVALFVSHIAAAGLLMAALGFARKHGGLAFFYRLALPCAGAGFVILALPDGGASAFWVAAVLLVGAGFEVINLVAWVLTAFAAQVSARPARYFGLYALVTYTAMLAGRLVNLAILPYASHHAAFLGLACIVALVVVALVVLPEDQVCLFEESLRLSQEERAALRRLRRRSRPHRARDRGAGAARPRTHPEGGSRTADHLEGHRRHPHRQHLPQVRRPRPAGSHRPLREVRRITKRGRPGNAGGVLHPKRRREGSSAEDRRSRRCVSNDGT